MNLLYGNPDTHVIVTPEIFVDRELDPTIYSLPETRQRIDFISNALYEDVKNNPDKYIGIYDIEKVFIPAY